MKGSFTTRKGALYCIVMTCLCSLLATGCASKYGAQTTDVHYYPDCYQPIADLRSAEKSFNTTMVMGTTMGALLGAVIGASQTGKAEGALAGAAIGGVSQYVLSQSLPGCMLCGAGLLAVLDGLRIAGALISDRGDLPALLEVAVPECLLSLAWMPLIYLLFRAVYRKVGGDKLA